MEPQQQLERLKVLLGERQFVDTLRKANVTPLRAKSIEILQMNIIRTCNLSCKHCHVEGGPFRSESMSRSILEQCLGIAALPAVTTIDITGGAPEMHPDLPWLLQQLAALRKRVIVRSNLVILLEPAYASYIELFTRYRIELVASIPAIDKNRTDKQRGSGSFDAIIAVMGKLNAVGYGVDGSGLILDLVHNPAGAFLAGSQTVLEAEYKRKLSQGYRVTFNHLFCLNNCPTGRFLEYLINSDNLGTYMQDLVGAFNPVAAQNVMCRSTLSIDTEGVIYDCDFNQMLGISVNHGAPRSIMDFDSARLINREIVMDNHCFVCTAGAGSSCQGVTT